MENVQLLLWHSGEDKQESNEPDYDYDQDEDKDQLEEEQGEDETAEISDSTINQVFWKRVILVLLLLFEQWRSQILFVIMKITHGLANNFSKF